MKNSRYLHLFDTLLHRKAKLFFIFDNYGMRSSFSSFYNTEKNEADF